MTPEELLIPRDEAYALYIQCVALAQSLEIKLRRAHTGAALERLTRILMRAHRRESRAYEAYNRAYGLWQRAKFGAPDGATLTGQLSGAEVLR